MVSEVKKRGVQESKNIDHAKHHIPHCRLPAKVMHPANSSKRFSWLTRSTSILLIKNVQTYKESDLHQNASLQRLTKTLSTKAPCRNRSEREKGGGNV